MMKDVKVEYTHASSLSEQLSPTPTKEASVENMKIIKETKIMWH